MVDARVHAAVGDEREDVHARRGLQRLEQHRVAAEAGQLRRLVDEREVLLDDGACPEIEMADLGVAHLPVGQPDGAAARGQRRVRIALPERVEDRRVRQRDGVAGTVRRESPAIEDDEADRGRGRHETAAYEAAATCTAASTMRAKDSGSSDAPPTSAPSTSGSASSSAALSGATEPP